MEERTLNEKESLELITRMLQNTKINLEVGSGNGLIIWGVSVFIANLLVATLLYLTHSPISNWAWMIVPAMGTIWTKCASSNRARVTTKIDKMVSNLFKTILIVTVVLPFAFWGLAIQTEQSMLVAGYKLMTLIPFAMMLIVSLGLIASAIIIDFKPMKIGGVVGAMLSLSLLCDSVFIHSLMSGVWAIASMIIPGIKLNHYIKSKKNV